MTSEAFTVIYNKSLDIVSRREHSRHEVFQKLDKRFPDHIPIIEDVLEKLKLNKTKIGTVEKKYTLFLK